MNLIKHKLLLILSNIQYFVVYALILFLSYLPNTASANRFSAPSLKLPLHEFEARLDSNNFNVDFLLAHILNNSRKTVREVGEISDTAGQILQNTAVFTNNNSGNTGVNAGSVVIPPGTTADTIIILNQNEGDSIAIQR